MASIPATSGSVSNPVYTAAPAATSSSANPYNLTTSDFINMMVTQLKNQDPTQPMSNAELMQQMSQIGQLQSTSQLQTTLTAFGLQTQIGGAAGLIGKTVQGIDASNNTIKGVVNSVSVSGNTVSLMLDSGQSLPFSGVTAIAPTSTAAAAATPAA